MAGLEPANGRGLNPLAVPFALTTHREIGRQGGSRTLTLLALHLEGSVSSNFTTCRDWSAWGRIDSRLIPNLEAVSYSGKLVAMRGIEPRFLL